MMHDIHRAVMRLRFGNVEADQKAARKRASGKLADGMGVQRSYTKNEVRTIGIQNHEST
jgi:hypothetical protein